MKMPLENVCALKKFSISPVLVRKFFPLACLPVARLRLKQAKIDDDDDDDSAGAT